MNSGRIQSGSANFTYFYFQWRLVSQNVGGNYSTINWQAGINISGGAYWLTNAVKIYDIFINGSGNLGSGTWSNLSGNGNHQLLSGSFNIGHNPDGSKNFGAQIDGWLYGEGNYGATGNWNLPTIPRYANIISFTASNVTDEGFQLQAITDQAASVINFSTDGGASYSGGGSGTSASQQFHNLPSGHTFTCYAHAVNASSGLDSWSGPITLTTLGQNNFMGLDPMV